MKKSLLSLPLALIMAACSSQAVVAPIVTLEPTVTQEEPTPEATQETIDLIVEDSQNLEVANFITREERARMATLPDQFPEYRDFPKSIYGEFKPEDFKAINYLDSQGGELHNLPLNYPFKLVFSWSGNNYSAGKLVNYGDIKIFLDNEFLDNGLEFGNILNTDGEGYFSLYSKIWLNLSFYSPEKDTHTLRLELSLDGQTESIEYIISSNLDNGLEVIERPENFDSLRISGPSLPKVLLYPEMDYDSHLDFYVNFCELDLRNKTIDELYDEVEHVGGFGAYNIIVANSVTGDILAETSEKFYGYGGVIGGPSNIDTMSFKPPRNSNLILEDYSRFYKVYPTKVLLELLDDQGVLIASYNNRDTIIKDFRYSALLPKEGLTWVSVGKYKEYTTDFISYASDIIR